MSHRRTHALFATLLLTAALAYGCDGAAPAENGDGGGSTARTLCSDTCGPPGDPGVWAGDGECDDGGEGAANAVCALGTDCRDCGPRSSSTMPASSDAGPPSSGDAGGPADAGPACGDLDALASAAERWGQSLDDYAAECCSQAEACAANADCVAYHGCLYDCFSGGGPDRGCIDGCQSSHPGFNEGRVYERFSGCIL